MSGSLLDEQNPTTILRSSDLVSRSFVPGISDPRQPHEFRAELTYTTSTGGNATIDSVLVRSVDRPSVEPQVEVLNQYNKKRTVVTGVKYRPLRMAFYDTRDSAIWRMMRDYLSYHFGDFNQNRQAWNYDQTYPRVLDTNGAGFGFGARFGARGNPNPDVSAAYFINRLVIYQGIGDQTRTEGVTLLELINPRVTEFDFDEFDYTQTNAVVVMNCTFEYEGMLLREEGDPRPLDGDVLSYKNELGTPTGTRDPNGNLVDRSAVDPFRGLRYGPDSLNFDPRRGNGSPKGGAVGGGLNIFGNFNFGNAAQAVVQRAITGGDFRQLPGDLSYMAAGNPVLAQVLNARNSRAPVAEIGNAILGSLQRPAGGASAAVWDTARAGLVGQSSLGGGRNGAAYTGGILAQAMLATALTGQPTRNSGNNGLSLTPTALGMVNAGRPAHAQFGYNPRTGGNG